MKYFYLLLVVSLSFTNLAEEGRFGRDTNDYQYTSFGFSLISAEDDGIALNASLALPGPLYALFERRADGVDLDNETYDKVVNSFRVGAHAGIGDILNSISAKGYGVEPSNEAVKYIQRTFPKIEATVGFGDDVPFFQKFDLVHLVNFLFLQMPQQSIHSQQT